MWPAGRKPLALDMPSPCERRQGAAVVLSEAKDPAVVCSVRHPERSEGSPANGDSLLGRCLASLDMTDWPQYRRVLRFAQDDGGKDVHSIAPSRGEGMN